tara:strand:+ start:288 stop:815 length:528 start_codon:yes stop_codon:yes gene_type:complete
MKRISTMRLTSFKSGELDELCKATEDALQGGIGFGWINTPSKERLEAYWKGVLLVPNRWLFIGRLDEVVAGTIQVVTPNPSNEAASFSVSIDTHFVAPWARGHGLALALLRLAENEAKKKGFELILLDVRETQERAINLYEQTGYVRWGTLPSYHRVRNKDVSGHFYFKDIKNSD